MPQQLPLVLRSFTSAYELRLTATEICVQKHKCLEDGLTATSSPSSKPIKVASTLGSMTSPAIEYFPLLIEPDMNSVLQSKTEIASET